MAVTKTWNTIGPNARQSHIAIDGETVGAYEPFSNGLQYPGDPEGSAAEVVGCTCLMTITGQPFEKPSLSQIPNAEVPNPLTSQFAPEVNATPKWWTVGQPEVEARALKLREALTVDENTAMDAFKAQSYNSKVLQQLLRAGTPIKPNTNPEWLLQHLDSALAKAPKIQGNGYQLYRGAYGLDNAVVGTILEDQGFATATAKLSRAKGFVGTNGRLVELHVPTGTPLGFQAEGDILLPRGMKWQVTEIKQDRYVLEAVTEKEVPAVVPGEPPIAPSLPVPEPVLEVPVPPAPATPLPEGARALNKQAEKAVARARAAATKEEAEAAIREYLGGKNEIDLDGLSTLQARQVAEAFIRRQGEFEALAGKRIATLRVNEFRYEPTGYYNRARYVKGDGIRFPDTGWQAIGDTVSYEAQSVAGDIIAGVTADNSFEYVVSHELGHFLDYRLGKAAPGMWRQLAKELNEFVGEDIFSVANRGQGRGLGLQARYFELQRSPAVLNFSKYGSQDIGEFFAEAFAESRVAVAPREIAQIVGNWVDRAIAETWGEGQTVAAARVRVQVRDALADITDAAEAARVQLFDEFRGLQGAPGGAVQQKVDNMTVAAARMVKDADPVALEKLREAGQRVRDGVAHHDPYLTSRLGQDPLLLSDEELGARMIADQLMQTWATSSTDTNPVALAVQRAVEEKFGLPRKAIGGSTGLNNTLTSFSGAARQAQLLIGDDVSQLTYSEVIDLLKDAPAIRLYVDTTYAITQERLAQLGIDRVWVFRGVKGRTGAPKSTSIPISMNPVSSFSVDFNTSNSSYFSGRSGVVFGSNVPADRIFCMTTTGPGCLGEYELLLIGGRDGFYGTIVRG